MPAEYLLEVRHIDKAFPGTQALQDVSMAFRPGEIHAVVGENGAGKSTLMLIIAGVHRRDAGEILLDGQAIEPMNPHHAQTLGVSIVYQELSLAPNLSVAENIFINRQPLNRWGLIDKSALHAEAARLLKTLDLTLPPATPVKNLNIATMQMVEIVGAMSRRTRVLLLDEPTSALTERETAKLFAALRQLKQEGITIIYIIHKLDEIMAIADRLTVLKDGKVAGALDIADATKEKIVHLMVGRELSALYPEKSGGQSTVALTVEGLAGPGFRDVSFALHGGEILGLAGLAGAGRTSVCRTIFGAVPRAAGRVRVAGREVDIQAPQDAIRAGIGFLPEDRKLQGLFLRMTLRENVVAASLKACSGAVMMDAGRETDLAGQLVRQLQIKTPSVEQKVMNLSGGNQQKALLGKWLAAQPKILLVAEPTRGVDVGAKAEIHMLLRELARQGVGVLMVSSELPEIMGMSDRVLVMHEGRVTGLLAGADVTEERIMAYASGLQMSEIQS
jgi:ribose transport system ATP-binding protein